MTRSDSDPILVVGAGPTGLTMASELARHGVGVRLIDKRPGPTETSNALAIQPRTLEVLETMRLADDFVSRGLRACGVSFFAGGRRVAGVDFAALPSRFPFILSLPQRDTEQLLGQRVRALQTSIERQVELLDVEQREDTVLAKTRRADGGEERIRCSFVVGCDYAHSPIVRDRSLWNGPPAGTRAPDVALVDVPTGRHRHLSDLLRPGRHVLLALQLGPPRQPQRALLAQLCRRIDSAFGAHVDSYLVLSAAGQSPAETPPGLRVVLDSSGDVRHKYNRAPAVYLIRPDGYVATRSTAASAGGDLPRYLAALFVAHAPARAAASADSARERLEVSIHAR
jgi:hypothetical protein